MGHAPSVRDGFLDKVLRLVQSVLIASPQCPGRVTILGILVVGNDFPFMLTRACVCIVNTGLRRWTSGYTRSLGLRRVIYLHAKRSEGSEKAALLRDGMVVLQGDRNCAGWTFNDRTLDITLVIQKRQTFRKTGDQTNKEENTLRSAIAFSQAAREPDTLTRLAGSTSLKSSRFSGSPTW